MKVLVSNLFLIAIMLLACSKGGDNTPEVVPVIELVPLSVQERNVNFTVCANIRLSEIPEKPVRVTVTTQNGTAEDGKDYLGISGQQIEFLPGTFSRDVCVVIIGDEDYEDDEYFSLIVSDVTGAQHPASPGQITIENDDFNVDVRIPESGYSSPESYPGMDLIWRDEFDNSIDPQKWSFEIGNGNGGWGNAESQYYRQENASVKEGNLVITALDEWFSGFNYTSTRMITLNKFSFRYGRVDIRAALPYGQGIWPALWMLGENFPTVGWPACGEIDIMELIGGNGRDNEVHGTAHWESNGGHTQYTGSIKLNSGTFNDEFHVFSIIWDENTIRWYMDDQLYNTFDIRGADRSEFHEKFFLIVNMAVGGRWPGYPDASTKFPQHLIVDYIRVFQEK